MTEPKLKITKLSHFRPQAENANAHTERGLGALSKAFGEVGYVAPMTAAADLEVIDGSARLETAATQFADEAIAIYHDGTRPIVMIREDVPDAKSDIAKKISYGANRIFELDLNWDAEQFAKDIETGLDLSGLFTEQEQAGILAQIKTEPVEPPLPPIDKADELQAKWQCQTGQVWQIASVANPGHYHRLICGDCRDKATVEILTQGKPVNGVFTSPPYAMQRAKQYGGVPTGEYVEWWEAVQDNIRGVLAEDGSFFVNIKPHCEDGQRVLYVFDLVLAMVRRWGWQIKDILYWDKMRPVPHDIKDVCRFYDAIEEIYHFTTDSKIKFRPDNVMVNRNDKGKKDSIYQNRRRRQRERAGETDPIYNRTGSGYHDSTTILNVNFRYPDNVLTIAPSDGFTHAATFPLKLPTFFIRAYSDPGDIWLDPFCGSGTTGIAAENEGRISLMIEQLPKYCAVILERFQTTFGVEPELIQT